MTRLPKDEQLIEWERQVKEYWDEIHALPVTRLKALLKTPWREFEVQAATGAKLGTLVSIRGFQRGAGETAAELCARVKDSQEFEDADSFDPLPRLCCNCKNYPFLTDQCGPGYRSNVTAKALAGDCRRFRDATAPPKSSGRDHDCRCTDASCTRKGCVDNCKK